MAEENNKEETIKQAYRRMHRYTCAEASLQALLEKWDIPKKEYSWATAGYLGAILAGQTTCGILIGSSIAIGIKHGLGKNGIPEEYEEERSAAIAEVNDLYKEFMKRFGSTDCKTLNQVDFNDSEAFGKWTVEKGWKKTCDVFLDFVIERHMK